MTYQLILQFEASSMEDFDQLNTFEEKLSIELDRLATIDGHDFGSGEFNIFVLTEDPKTTFEKLMHLLTQKVYKINCELLTGIWQVTALLSSGLQV